MAGVRRTFLDRWAQSGAQTDPLSVKTQLGWVQEKPPYQFFNWVMARVDDMLAHFEEQAVADWNIATPYLVGGLSMGSDRLVYRAVQANTGIDPVLDATGTNWVVYVPTASSAEAGVVELATGPETATGTDSARAITPLGLLSRTATSLRTGLIQLAIASEAQSLSNTVKAITPATLGTVIATEATRGLVELANAQELADGIDATRAVTPAALGSLANLLANNGYQTMPGGLIIQWGQAVNVTGLLHDIVLPIAFPNAFFAAFATVSDTITNTFDTVHDPGAKPQLLTTVRLSSSNTIPLVYWLAIGN